MTALIRKTSEDVLVRAAGAAMTFISAHTEGADAGGADDGTRVSCAEGET